MQALPDLVPAIRTARDSNQFERVCGLDYALESLATLARFDIL